MGKNSDDDGVWAGLLWKGKTLRYWRDPNVWLIAFFIVGVIVAAVVLSQIGLGSLLHSDCARWGLACDSPDATPRGN
jgi:hypothetical protein